MSDDPEVTVTLLHGTFAKNADWPSDDSMLCKALANAFGARMLRTRCRWSGWNTIRARESAAKELQRHLQGLTGRYPKAKHFIIGHSHGGSVAWRCLQDNALAERITGIVTLATPFLHAQPRPLALADDGHAETPHLGKDSVPELAAAAVIVATATALLGYLTHAINPRHALPLWGLWGPAVLLSAVALAGFLLRYVVLPRLKAAETRVLEPFTTPALPSEKALIIRVAGDEASGLLNTAAFASWIVTRTGSTIAAVCNAASRRSAWAGDSDGRETIVGLSGAFFVAGIVVSALREVGGFRYLGLDNAGWADKAHVMLFAIPILLFLLLAFFAAASVLLHIVEGIIGLVSLGAVLLSVPTSFDLWFLPVTTAISAEPCPPGAYTIHQFDSRAEQAAPVPSGLAHSIAYNDPRVIRLLIQWIEERERVGSASRMQSATT